MRNDVKNKFLTSKVLSLAEKLPYFTVENFKLLDIDKDYLRVILSRLKKREAIIRLKKGLYASRFYLSSLKEKGSYSSFLEFLACFLHRPAYLSLDYMLYENNILTEAPVNFTLISKNKTAKFSNDLGNFIYHHIKKELFCGFEIKREHNFIISKATKAKALFDFLYFRKNIILGKDSFRELRLNLSEFSLQDKRELKKYINREGSNKMKEIFNLVF